MIRVSTPIVGLKSGANFLIIGKSITKSINPLESLEKIIIDLNQ